MPSSALFTKPTSVSGLRRSVTAQEDVQSVNCAVIDRTFLWSMVPFHSDQPVPGTEQFEDHSSVLNTFYQKFNLVLSVYDVRRRMTIKLSRVELTVFSLVRTRYGIQHMDVWAGAGRREYKRWSGVTRSSRWVTVCEKPDKQRSLRQDAPLWSEQFINLTKTQLAETEFGAISQLGCLRVVHIFFHLFSN